MHVQHCNVLPIRQGDHRDIIVSVGEYQRKIVKVHAPMYGLYVEVPFPGFLARLFGDTIEKRVVRAKKMLQKELINMAKWETMKKELQKLSE